MHKLSKSIAIIGGGGFLGARLSSVFKDKQILYKSFDVSFNTQVENGLEGFIDVENKESLNQLKDFDVIVNLAAVHRDDVVPVSRYDDVNVKGAKNLCEAASQHDINTIIFTSSVAIYGFSEPGTDESGEPNFFNDYGRTKYLAEQAYKEWLNEDPSKRNLIIIRPTVIFGEGNRGNVYNLLKQIALKRFILFGRGFNKKSLAYVGNVAAFIEYSLNFTRGLHIYNYVDSPDFTMRDLISKARLILHGKQNVGIRLPLLLGKIIGVIADILAKYIKLELPVSSIRVKKFITTTQFKSSIKDTGFEAPHSLETALERTIKYEFIRDESD